MTIQELDDEIIRRKNELEDKEKKEAYEHIKEYVENNKIDTILDFVNINIWEFLKCSIYINCNKKDMEYYSFFIDYYKDFFDSIKVSSIESILALVFEYLKNDKIDDVIELFNNDGLKSQMNFIKNSNNSLALKMVALKKKTESSGIKFAPFLETVRDNKEQFIKEFSFYLTFRKVMDSLRNKVFEVYANPENERQLELIKINTLKRELSDNFNVDAIVNKMSSVKYYKEEYERVERNNQRELLGLDKARSYLDRELDKKQIIMYREIIKGIKSPRMMYLFLKYIKEHNELYYEELEEELNRLKQDSKIAIQALLNDYGIHKDSYDYDSLPSYTKEELESILKVISILDITNEEKIRIIKSTSLDKINTLKNYLDREIISKEFVSNNTYILDEDSIELDNLKENIELLKNYNISVSIFANSINILMNDPSLISNNLNILSSYNLLEQLSETKNLYFLLSDNIESIIDKYLELGFEEYLENDLELLNKKELERIEVLKAIGIPVTSKEELEFYLNEDKEFFIPVEEINKYLIDDSIYVEEPVDVVTIEKLEQYKSNRVYDFNGTKISIEKVKRLLSNDYTLYQAIIYNTYLSEEELLNIKNIISNEKGLKKVSC